MALSRVFFTDVRASFRENLLDKFSRLMDTVGLKGLVPPQSLVAVKLHFGEKGNLAFIRPNFIRRIVDYLKALGASPFLTDTNTLYVGARGDSVSHLNTAIENGFAYDVVHAPIIIGDGLRGASSAAVKIDQENIKIAYIGKEIFESDILISVAHFKGHELSGFGGTIKNLGMGCAARQGKLAQHSGLSPKAFRKRCVGCGSCIEHCAQSAIALKDGKALIDPKRCVGCGECIVICPNKAIDVRWNADVPFFQKKMVEYMFAVLMGKKGKVAFINFLTQISPACDCSDHNDAPFVQDLGIMASMDPVAIDQASVDMINRQTALDGSCLLSNKGAGEDKFRGLYPKVDWTIQLDYAEKLGLGQRNYELVKI
ncbi:MAG: DUF362 domain-containing protein [Pseudomonadota bacterium]